MRVAFVLLPFLLSIGCGVKGPPLPPETTTVSSDADQDAKDVSSQPASKKR